jgi:hypothetical protein
MSKKRNLSSVISHLSDDVQDAIHNCVDLSYGDLMLTGSDYTYLNSMMETELADYTRQYEQATLTALKSNLLKLIDLCKYGLQLLHRLIAYTAGDYSTVLEGIGDNYDLQSSYCST